MFVCCVPHRPNDIDRLYLMSRWWRVVWQGQEGRAKLITSLFSDDDLCKKFGFNQCLTESEIANLLCIYYNLLQCGKSSELQIHIELGTLGDHIRAWLETNDLNLTPSGGECLCIPWFLKQRQESFRIPDLDGPFAYQNYACHDLEGRFTLCSRGPSLGALNAAELKVARLYLTLLRPFNNEPKAWTSEWFDFGFCYCTSDSQRRSLARAYVGLASEGVSLDQIASRWEHSSLGLLMKEKGVDTAGLEANGVYFRAPQFEEFGIYRLMAEVKHALLGCYCLCFRPPCPNHSKHEFLLSKESEGDYGFHGANTWERWQLLNFYSHVFAHPAFDPRAMQEARRNPEPDALEIYLDSLIPDFRRKIWNQYIADVMFPKLRARVSFPQGRPHCGCVNHTVLISEGLDSACFYRIRLLRGESVDDVTDGETDERPR